MNTSANMRSRRKQLGLTQLDVAKAVGVSEATVSRWESGDIAEVGSSKIGALANVLKLSPSQLLGTVSSFQPSTSITQNSVPMPNSALDGYLHQLRTRPEMRAFFSLAQNASKQEVEDAMRIVEAYFAGRHAGRGEDNE